MTTVGKVLTFMILIFSCLTAAMVFLVFSTRANWKRQAEEMERIAFAAEAAYKSEAYRHATDVESREADLKGVRSEKLLLKTELDKSQAALLKAQGELNDKNTHLNTETTTQKTLSAEVGQIKSERESLIKERGELQVSILTLQKEVNTQKFLAVTNKNEADAQKQKAGQLLTRVEELEKVNLQLSNQLQKYGGDRPGSSGSLVDQQPPAPKGLKGSVTAVNATGQAVISLGSDSGIAVGNVLEVYRSDAARPLYLGKFIVSRTEFKQSVGQFYPKPFAKPDEKTPKVSDQVATSLDGR